MRRARRAGDVTITGRGSERGRSRALVLVGGAGIVAAALVLLAAVALPHGRYLLRTDPYTAELANAAGLEAGDPVLVAGVPTGKVESIDFAGDRVEVRFRLDDGRPLGARTTASVQLATILGKRYLAVDPAGSGEVGPDRTIPLARTTVPYSLDEASRSAADTAQEIDVRAVEEMVDALRDSLPQDPDTVRRAVTGVSAAAEAMNENSAQIGVLLDAGKSLTGLLARQDRSLDTVSAEARTMLGALAARRQAISGLAEDLRTILGAADAVLASADGAGPGGAGGLDRLVGDLRSVLATLDGNAARIGEVVDRLPPVVRAVVDAGGNGNWIDVSAPAGPVPDTLLCVFGVMEGCR
ncbi:MCE family protein [Tomitella fengzijianii]|uniref:MCE family protein n=2 Tax=Tomitella fengzijianii TaxID=2597660 RepID=A0A516X7G4_9ACTN|nr:MCE family protein [Tomitella fengzijianii]